MLLIDNTQGTMNLLDLITSKDISEKHLNEVKSILSNNVEKIV